MARRNRTGDDNGQSLDEPRELLIARGLAELAAEHNLSELVLDTKDVKLTVRRGGGVPVAAMPMPMPMPMAMPAHAPPAPSPFAPSAAAAPSPQAAAAPASEEKGHAVTSPFVGTFYRKPNPDSPPYVSLNERVEKGQVLCIVEAMKLMNEIEADISGTVLAILVEDGAPVEYGQPLFRIQP
jgi:acetyl-CoA carboxylase biotin carboxyl carrier protein